MRNIEIKAKISDYNEICKRAEKLSGSCGKLIEQDDTFYNVHHGRMKMRFTDSAATLVRYSRDTETGPKLSNYDLLSFNEITGKKLNSMLIESLGVRGRVVKKRMLFMVGQTRVHIDRVNDLGDFMELEVVLRPEQTVEEGKKIAECLQKELGVEEKCLIDCAYVDLLDCV